MAGIVYASTQHVRTDLPLGPKHFSFAIDFVICVGRRSGLMASQVVALV